LFPYLLHLWAVSNESAEIQWSNVIASAICIVLLQM